MSGIGPAGWSFSLNYASSLTSTNVPFPRVGGRSALVTAGWALLRLCLGVVYGMIFETLGASVLGQTSYSGFDFATHLKSRAQIFIGATGGITMGILILLFDVGTARLRAIADVEPYRPNTPFPPASLTIPNLWATRNQAAVRILLWPIYAAISGVVGTSLWHLHANSRPQPHAGDRSGTGAVVQVVGSAIIVSGPSILEAIVLSGAGNKLPA